MNESIIYNTKKTDPGKLKLFLDWLNLKELVYTLDKEQGHLEIYNEKDLEKDSGKELNVYISRLGFEKVWENITAISNTVGLGAVNPPSAGHIGGQPDSSGVVTKGSGDRFDNGSAETDEEDEDEDGGDKKKKKKKKKVDILSYESFVISINNKNIDR